jgi:hypothetical protein
LKASCHKGGPDKAALKGILLDSASMNLRGSEVPTGPRKYDVELASVWIKSSVESSYQEKTEEEIWSRSRKEKCRMNLKGMKFTWAAWFWSAIEDLSLGKRWLRVWIWTETPMDCRGRE